MTTLRALAAVPLLVLALAGCTPTGSEEPPTSDTDGAESADGDALDGGSTSCLTDREWILDVEDGAAQLGESLAHAGLTVTSSSGEGRQTIWFDSDGTAGSDTDLAYTIVAEMDAGLVMTMRQHHLGSPGGTWMWAEEPTSLAFSDWDADYTVTTDTSINGTAAPSSTIPAGGLAGLGGSSMEVSCDGNALTTQAEGSPFIQHWVAGDER